MALSRFEMEYPADYLQEVKQRQERQNARRVMWLGKFAFPAVNTKNTKLMCFPSGTRNVYFPVMSPIVWEPNPSPFAGPPEIDKVEIQGWAYNGKRWRARVHFAYYEKGDVLVVEDKSLQYGRMR